MSLAQSELIYTIAEYLTLERESEERHEYLDGQIFLMAGESIEHGIICVNFAGQLYNQLRGRPCQTFTKDMKVRSGPNWASIGLAHEALVGVRQSSTLFREHQARIAGVVLADRLSQMM